MNPPWLFDQSLASYIATYQTIKCFRYQRLGLWVFDDWTGMQSMASSDYKNNPGTNHYSTPSLFHTVVLVASASAKTPVITCRI